MDFLVRNFTMDFTMNFYEGYHWGILKSNFIKEVYKGSLSKNFLGEAYKNFIKKNYEEFLSRKFMIYHNTSLSAHFLI